MVNPVIPPLTPADKDKMPILDSATNPVLQMKFKPFIFEPEKLKPGETGAIVTGDADHPYAYKTIRPYLDTHTFRHRMSSYIESGFALSNSNNKLVVAPGKMKVYLPSAATVAASYIDVDYSGATIDVSSFGAVPYNFPMPVIAYITTNGNNTLSLEVKVGALKAEAFNHYKEYITIGTILVSPSNIISIINTAPNWKPSSVKIQDIIAAVSPMQHNIVPVLDDKKFGIKVKLGDHASIYDRSVIPHDLNFKHTQWKPAAQVRLTVLDSNGGYVDQEVTTPSECVVAGKMQDVLRNGSPVGMATGQYALHPLFYTAQVDAHGNPVEGVLYMQLAQTVYNKPIGSQGLFFVEEYMLDEALGNFERCDVVANTAAFIGFFVCGAGVADISECEIIVASDGFSKSFVDPAGTLPADGLNDAFVTYHDDEYHADGVAARPAGAVLGTSSYGVIEPALDFGSDYYQFKIRISYDSNNRGADRAQVGSYTTIELFNKKHPNGVKSTVAGSDAAKLKEMTSFIYGNNYGQIRSILGQSFSQMYVRAVGIDFQTGKENAGLALLWGVEEKFLTDEIQKKMMPVFFNFNLGITSQIITYMPIPGVGDYTPLNHLSYSFIEDASFLLDCEPDDKEFYYVSRFGENSGDYCMSLFAPKRQGGTPSKNTPGYFGVTSHHATLYDAAVRVSLKTSAEAGKFHSLGFSAGSPMNSGDVQAGYMTGPDQGKTIFSMPAVKTLSSNSISDKPGVMLQDAKLTVLPRYDSLTKNPAGQLPDSLKRIAGEEIVAPGMENYSKQYVDRLLVITSMLLVTNFATPATKSMVSFNCSTGLDDKGITGTNFAGNMKNSPPSGNFEYELEGGGYIPK